MTVQEEIDKHKGYKAIEVIGQYVIRKMAEDENFKNAWEEKKRTLDQCLRYAREKAQQKYMNGKSNGSVCVDDTEVLAWVYEFVIDVEGKHPELCKAAEKEPEETEEETKDEEQEKPAEEPKKEEPKPKKGRPAKQSSGEQLTLF